jgi:predicted MFS family arabinose efflux permease
MKLFHRLVIISTVDIGVIGFASAEIGRSVGANWGWATAYLIIVGIGVMTFHIWYSLPKNQGGHR